MLMFSFLQQGVPVPPLGGRSQPPPGGGGEGQEGGHLGRAGGQGRDTGISNGNPYK